MNTNRRNAPVRTATYRNLTGYDGQSMTRPGGYIPSGVDYMNANGGNRFSYLTGVVYTPADVPTLTSQKQEYENQIVKYQKAYNDYKTNYDAAIKSRNEYQAWYNSVNTRKKFDNQREAANVGVVSYGKLAAEAKVEMDSYFSKLNKAKADLVDVNAILATINTKGSAEPTSNPAVPKPGDKKIVTPGMSIGVKIAIGAGVVIGLVVIILIVKKAAK